MATRAHSRLSPSAASRWLRCPASVNFIEEEDLGDEGGVSADEGTVLHSFCETTLKMDISPYKLVGEVRHHNDFSLELTDDHADMIQEGLDWIDDLPGNKMYVEKRVDLSRWMPGQGGTLDLGLIYRLYSTIWDWKWGFLPVSPVENDQERIYALGFWDNYVRHIEPRCKKFKLIIFQPRAPGGGGEWDVHLDDLLDWAQDLKKAARATYDPEAPFVPGEKQCYWCPGAKNLVCKAYKRYVAQMLIRDFDEEDENIKRGLPMRLTSDGISLEMRSHIINNRTMINKFLDRLEAQALDDALKGRPVPGLKAVDGRTPSRKWIDAEKAEEEIRKVLDDEQAYSRKLISPTQFEKEVSAFTYNRLQGELVDRGERKAILVPEGDSRPSRKSLREEFDEGE